jgi:alpha-beta hydrolase superfamily lysophospholipase
MTLSMRPLTDAVVGAGREALAVGAAVARYRRRFEVPVPPSTLRPTWKTRPVVLVHGFGHNAGAWSKLATRLVAAGFSELVTVTYGIGDDVPAIAGRIRDAVDAITTSSAVERVHLVGHSLGGVAIRYWYDVLGGDRHADAVVTLGAPLRGTFWTKLPLLRPPARDLAADSPVTRTLGRRQRRHDHWTTVGGTFDVVVPPTRAHLDDADVVDVPVGHAGLLTSSQAGGAVCIALLHAEEVRAAATSS